MKKSCTIPLTLIAACLLLSKTQVTAQKLPVSDTAATIADSVKKMEGVTITAARQLIKQEADRISYNLQADPESKSNSVLEMMRKIPYLTVDANENLLVKGNSSYKILINGKPSGMMDMNAKEILRSMPASTIERVEVITTPPSRYDAEGLGGIINIITVKKVSDGYNGSLNINQRFPAGGQGGGGSFNMKRVKTGISAFGGASRSQLPSSESSGNRITYGPHSTGLLQNTTRSTGSRSAYGGLELSYEPDTLHLLSAQFNLNGNRSDGFRRQQSSLSASTSIIQQYDVNNYNRSSGNGWDAALNYQLGSKKDKNRILTFSYRYSISINEQADSLSIFNRLDYETPDYRQANKSDFKEQTLQADYIIPGKVITIEAGLKAIFRDNESNFQYYALNPGMGKFEQQMGRSNNYGNKQSIFGAYNTYLYNIKTWNFKGGFRIEQTITRATFISTGSGALQNYFNVLPTLSVNKTISKKSSVNMGITQRIKRPGINRLNPFIDRSVPYVESSGNPDLKAALITDLQLSYSSFGKTSFNIGVGVSFARRMDFSISTFDPRTSITHIVYRNSGAAKRLGLEASLTHPITSQWNVNIKAGVEFYRVNSNADSSFKTAKLSVQKLSIATGYTFKHGWKLNASLNASGRNPASLQGTLNAYASTAFSISKDILKNNLSASASINNPFTQYRYNRTETRAVDFLEISSSQEYFRQFRIAINYRFGKLKDGIKKNQRGIKNDDISLN